MCCDSAYYPGSSVVMALGYVAAGSRGGCALRREQVSARVVVDHEPPIQHLFGDWAWTLDMCCGRQAGPVTRFPPPAEPLKGSALPHQVWEGVCGQFSRLTNM
jgi:hypothetical protein